MFYILIAVIAGVLFLFWKRDAVTLVREREVRPLVGGNDILAHYPINWDPSPSL